MAKNTSGDRNFSEMKAIKRGDAEEKNIYANTDNINIHNLCRGTEDTTRNQISQHTDIKTVRLKMKRYRSVSVCLVLLCVLLLTAVIMLCVLIKNLTEERDELIAKYNNITKLGEQWNQKINGLWTGLCDGWIYYQSSLYFISSEKKNWTESRRYCREKGADLIIINNKEEQDFFKNRSETNGIWIGLTDIDEEDRWKWVDNSTLNTSFWDKLLYNEPSGGRSENCVVSYSPGWADYSCTRTLKWICEKTFF